MSIKSLFNQFVGNQSGLSSSSLKQGLEQLVGGSTAHKMKQHSKQSSNFSGDLGKGVLGGVAAGGIVSLLLSNKKARKFSKKAATWGGAALLGGVAYTAYKNWQDKNSSSHPAPETQPSEGLMVTDTDDNFQLSLMKAMIAAAKADGHIDADEQKRIFEAVEKLDLSSEDKGMVFDLLNAPVSIKDVVNGIEDMGQKSELYLASCLVCGADHPDERRYLDKLSIALDLPHELATDLERQVFES